MSQATVLYDAPGPRGKRISKIVSVVGLAVIIAFMAWVIWRLAQPQTAVNGVTTPGMFHPSRWDIWVDPQVWKYLWGGIVATLKAAFVAIIGALILGTLLAFGRLSSHWWVRLPVSVFLEFFRGIPVLLLMLFILLVASTSAFWAAVLALALYNGAIVGEALRAGIMSLHKGQREAGLSIGLRPYQARLLIEFPQAFMQMLPVLIAQMAVLLKDTSLAYIVAYPELASTVRNLGNFYGNRYLFSSWLIPTLIYLAINFSLSWLARMMAKRMAASPKRQASEEFLEEEEPLLVEDPAAMLPPTTAALVEDQEDYEDEVDLKLHGER